MANISPIYVYVVTYCLYSLCQNEIEEKYLFLSSKLKKPWIFYRIKILIFVFNWRPFIKYVRNIFRKKTFLTPWYARVRVRIRGLEMLVSRKILRTYLMDDPLEFLCLQACLNYQNWKLRFLFWLNSNLEYQVLCQIL